MKITKLQDLCNKEKGGFHGLTIANLTAAMLQTPVLQNSHDAHVRQFFFRKHATGNFSFLLKQDTYVA
jgi:hypothetical protein